MFALVSKLLPHRVVNSLIGAYYKVSLIGAEGYHSSSRIIKMDGMTVRILPALGDNYMYLDGTIDNLVEIEDPWKTSGLTSAAIMDDLSKEAAVVDPVEPERVLNAVKEEGVTLTKVFTTHHHWDHAGGNNKLLKKIKVDVYGGDSRVEGISKTVSDGTDLKIGTLDVTCLATPCHTTGHICYHVRPAGQSGAVFTGDTLFIGGCGRFFEGTATQMYAALVEKLGSLPNETKVYCGHEYTCANLKFAETVEPENSAIQDKLSWAEATRADALPTVPSTIGEEKLYNPFMRVVEENVMKRYNVKDPIQAMKMVREDKDKFKA